MTEFLNQIKEQKKLLIPFIENFFTTEAKNYQEFSFGSEAMEKLETLVKGGKMSRSSLFLLSYQTLTENDDPHFKQKVLLPIATALELIHSGLLIHDDIIDQDEKRRGNYSIWQQYNLALNNLHYGESQAICVGNFAYFLANILTNQSIANLVHFPGLHSPKALIISNIINREINQVILAEMLDVKLAIQENNPSEKEILEMYRCKTARYTFSLPMILAAHLNKLESIEIKKLDKIGEKIGLLYQIQDDYLGILGDPKITGKPIAGDIKEGKRTIIYHYLIENPKLSDENREKFLEIFGQNEINTKSLEWAQNLIKKYALAKTKDLINQLKTEAKELIAQVKSKKIQALLVNALNFSYQREK